MSGMNDQPPGWRKGLNVGACLLDALHGHWDVVCDRVKPRWLKRAGWTGAEGRGRMPGFSLGMGLTLGLTVGLTVGTFGLTASASAQPQTAERAAASATQPAPAQAASSSSALAAAGPVPAARPGAMAQVIGRSDRLWVVVPAPGDTHSALAERFLGRTDRAFWLAAGGAAAPTPGEPLVVPLRHPNPTGVQSEGLQAVPVLAYHRFGAAGSKMVVTPEAFDQQLQALAEDGVSVQRLAALRGFLSGQEALPAKSVVITVDDGHESFYRLAFPLLRKHGVPVTLFVPSDAVGTRETLTWEQLQEMVATGLVDVQAHSKSARNLVERAPGDSDLAYRRGLEVEVQAPRKAIEQRLPGVTVTHFAFPFGQANASLLDTLQRNAFELGLTGQPGSNAFFTHPFQLQRHLVLGDQGLADFKAKLQWLRPLPKTVTP